MLACVSRHGSLCATHSKRQIADETRRKSGATLETQSQQPRPQFFAVVLGRDTVQWRVASVVVVVVVRRIVVVVDDVRDTAADCVAHCWRHSIGWIDAGRRSVDGAV